MSKLFSTELLKLIYLLTYLLNVLRCERVRRGVGVHPGTVREPQRRWRQRRRRLFVREPQQAARDEGGVHALQVYTQWRCTRTSRARRTPTTSSLSLTPSLTSSSRTTSSLDLISSTSSNTSLTSVPVRSVLEESKHHILLFRTRARTEPNLCC